LTDAILVSQKGVADLQRVSLEALIINTLATDAKSSIITAASQDLTACKEDSEVIKTCEGGSAGNNSTNNSITSTGDNSTLFFIKAFQRELDDIGRQVDCANRPIPTVSHID